MAFSLRGTLVLFVAVLSRRVSCGARSLQVSVVLAVDLDPSEDSGVTREKRARGLEQPTIAERGCFDFQPLLRRPSALHDEPREDSFQLSTTSLDRTPGSTKTMGGMFSRFSDKSGEAAGGLPGGTAGAEWG